MAVGPGLLVAAVVAGGVANVALFLVARRYWTKVPMMQALYTKLILAGDLARAAKVATVAAQMSVVGALLGHILLHAAKLWTLDYELHQVIRQAADRRRTLSLLHDLATVGSLALLGAVLWGHFYGGAPEGLTLQCLGAVLLEGAALLLQSERALTNLDLVPNGALRLRNLLFTHAGYRPAYLSGQPSPPAQPAATAPA